ncbi:putative protocadherin Fat 1/2/3 [Paratrimastix pyriformis]|uniref:Protocadherin Fat 1/2/3 n=1 Tax=Paratrimastix pyriformis TaxID=342808 RepID=A0ABQ8UWD7_9EUKA|nr:putative protocadherin Fat 1/2/3 [Paratrimastix pyriformis]
MMEPSPGPGLFSLDLYIDSCTLFQHSLPISRPAIAFRFLDFPTVLLYSEVSAPVPSSRKDLLKYSFRTGKSCLFESTLESLFLTSRSRSLLIMFVDAGDSLARCRLVGSIAFPTHRLLNEAVPYSDSPMADRYWIREQMPLFDVASNTAGLLAASLRLVQYGRALVPHFAALSLAQPLQPQPQAQVQAPSQPSVPGAARSATAESRPLNAGGAFLATALGTPPPPRLGATGTATGGVGATASAEPSPGAGMGALYLDLQATAGPPLVIPGRGPSASAPAARPSAPSLWLPVPATPQVAAELWAATRGQPPALFLARTSPVAACTQGPDGTSAGLEWGAAALVPPRGPRLQPRCPRSQRQAIDRQAPRPLGLPAPPKEPIGTAPQALPRATEPISDWRHFLPAPALGGGGGSLVPLHSAEFCSRLASLLVRSPAGTAPPPPRASLPAAASGPIGTARPQGGPDLGRSMSLNLSASAGAGAGAAALSLAALADRSARASLALTAVPRPPAMLPAWALPGRRIAPGPSATRVPAQAMTGSWLGVPHGPPVAEATQTPPRAAPAKVRRRSGRLAGTGRRAASVGATHRAAQSAGRAARGPPGGDGRAAPKKRHGTARPRLVSVATCTTPAPAEAAGPLAAPPGRPNPRPGGPTRPGAPPRSGVGVGSAVGLGMKAPPGPMEDLAEEEPTLPPTPPASPHGDNSPPTPAPLARRGPSALAAAPAGLVASPGGELEYSADFEGAAEGLSPEASPPGLLTASTPLPLPPPSPSPLRRDLARTVPVRSSSSSSSSTLSLTGGAQPSPAPSPALPAAQAAASSQTSPRSSATAARWHPSPASPAHGAAPGPSPRASAASPRLASPDPARRISPPPAAAPPPRPAEPALAPTPATQHPHAVPSARPGSSAGLPSRPANGTGPSPPAGSPSPSPSPSPRPATATPTGGPSRQPSPSSPSPVPSSPSPAPSGPPSQQAPPSQPQGPPGEDAPRPPSVAPTTPKQPPGRIRMPIVIPPRPGAAGPVAPPATVPGPGPSASRPAPQPTGAALAAGNASSPAATPRSAASPRPSTEAGPTPAPGHAPKPAAGSGASSRPSGSRLFQALRGGPVSPPSSPTPSASASPRIGSSPRVAGSPRVFSPLTASGGTPRGYASRTAASLARPEPPAPGVAPAGAPGPEAALSRSAESTSTAATPLEGPRLHEEGPSGSPYGLPSLSPAPTPTRPAPPAVANKPPGAAGAGSREHEDEKAHDLRSAGGVVVTAEHRSPLGANRRPADRREDPWGDDDDDDDLPPRPQNQRALGATQFRPISASCPAIGSFQVFAMNHACFVLNNGQMKVADAATWCLVAWNTTVVPAGGHLATIANSVEWTVVKALMTNQEFWIGLTRTTTTDTTFYWSDGNLSTYRNWATGEPTTSSNSHFEYGSRQVECCQWRRVEGYAVSRGEFMGRDVYLQHHVPGKRRFRCDVHGSMRAVHSRDMQQHGRLYLRVGVVWRLLFGCMRPEPPEHYVRGDKKQQRVRPDAGKSNGISWQAQYTLVGTETEGAQGFVISWAIDTTEMLLPSPVSTATTGVSSIIYVVSSNNPTTTLAKTGNVVILSLTVSEALAVPPAVTLAGHAATVSLVGSLTYTATVTMTGSEPEGVITFVVSGATDLAGNVQAAVVTTTDGSAVTYDRTAPTVATATIASNNGLSTARAKSGDTVTVTFTTNEPLKAGVDPVVKIGIPSATVTRISGTSFTATLVLGASDVEGPIGFGISGCIDLAGNVQVGTLTAATSGPSSVVFDRTAPTLPTVHLASSNADPLWAKQGDTITVTFAASEDLYLGAALPTVYIGTHLATVVWTAGSSPSAFTATAVLDGTDADGSAVGFSIAGCVDLAGNPQASPVMVTATTDGSAVTYDLTAPTLTMVGLASSGGDHTRAKSGDTVTVTFVAAEPLKATSGALPTVSIGTHAAAVTATGASGGTSTSFTATAVLDGSDAEGPVTFAIGGCTDRAGNVQGGGPVSAVTDGSSVTYGNSRQMRGSKGTLVVVGPTSDWKPVVQRAIEGAQGPLRNADRWCWRQTAVGGRDRTAPSFSPVQVSSSNASPTRAKTGDTVTLSFTASETLLTLPTVNIAGQTAAVVAGAGGAGLAYTATVTLAGAESEGVLAIAIRGAADLAGNVQADVTATSDGSSVTYDRTAPTLPTVHLASSNADPLWAKQGDTITVTFAASEDLYLGAALPTVYIGTHLATVVWTAGSSPSAFTATAVLDGTDADGSAVGFSIAGCVDLAGNPQASPVMVTATTDGSAVTYDLTAPTLTMVGLASSGGDHTRAKSGDTVTVTFVAAEPLKATSGALPTVSIGTHAAAVTATGASGGTSTSFTATAVLDGSDAEGPVTFAIGGCTDRAGNVQGGGPVSAVTDGSSVTYDQTLPSFSALQISSDNPTTTLAKTGNVVILSLTVSEALAVPPAVTLAGHAATVSLVGSLTYTATVTMTGSEPEGVITFVVSGATDLAGNVQAAVVTTTDGSAVTYDRTAPTVATATIASNNGLSTARAKSGDTVTVTFTTNEPLKAGVDPVVKIGIPSATVTRISGTSFTATLVLGASDVEGPIGFGISGCIDLAGNVQVGTLTAATSGPSSVVFDRTAPTLPTVHLASSNADPLWAKQGDTITVTFAASEDLYLGAALPTVYIGTHLATVVWTAGSSPSAFTATAVLDGTDADGSAVGFSIAGCVDLAGNPQASPVMVTATTDGSAVTYDPTAPTLTMVGLASSGGDHTRAKSGDTVTVTFVAAEPLKATSGALPTVSIGTHAAAVTATGASGGTSTSFTATAVLDGSDGPELLAGASQQQQRQPDPGQDGRHGDAQLYGPWRPTTLPTVNIAGQTAAVVAGAGGAGLAYTATVTLAGAESEGVLAIAIRGAADLAGNVQADVTATSDGSLGHDRTAPTLPTVHLASSNADPLWAKQGDTITVTFAASEDLYLGAALPTVYIGTHPATVVWTAGSPSAFTATAVLDGTDADGSAVGFSIAGCVDLAGNPQASPVMVTATTDGSAVTYDLTAPTLTMVGLASSGGDHTRAKSGDTVTVTFVAAEPLKATSGALPTVSIGTHAAAVTATGASGGTSTSFTATAVLDGSDAEGPVTFAIGGCTDRAGNVQGGGPVSAVTDGSSVTYDQTLPSFSALQISSDNPTTTLAKTGNVVILSLTVSEALAVPPAVTLAGHAATVSLVGSLTYTATVTMTGSEPEGVITFVVSGATDLAGNVQAAVVTTTDGSAVTYDRTAPTVATATIASNNGLSTARAKSGDTVTVTFTTNEPLKAGVDPVVKIGIPSATVTRISGTSFTATLVLGASDVEGPIGFGISGCIDLAGNVQVGTLTAATSGPSSVVFDRTAPTLPTVHLASSNADPLWAKQGDTITVTFAASEDLYLGAALPTVYIGTHLATVVWTAGSSPSAFTATAVLDGTDADGSAVGFSIAGCVDLAGNPQASPVMVTATTDGSAVTYDRTPPTLVSLAFTSTFPLDSSTARIGDSAVLVFTSSEPLLLGSSGPVTAIGTHSVSVSGGPTLWTASYRFVASDPEGPTGFRITAGFDRASNPLVGLPIVSNPSGNSTVNFTKFGAFLERVTFTSSNLDHSRAMLGDTVTLNFTCSEPLQTGLAAPSVTLAGRVPTSLLSAASRTTWLASIVLGLGDPEGPVGFVVISGMDDLGNGILGAPVTLATSGPDVIAYDRTAPDFPSIGIVSSNPTPTLAKTGDTVTVTFTASEALLALPAVTIAGRTAVVASRGGLLYAATLVLAGTEPEGSIGFVISGATDLAGNPQAAPASVATDGSAVLYDRTGPGFSGVSIISSNADPTLARDGDTVTVTLTVSEALLADPIVTIGGRSAPVSRSGLTFTAALVLGPGDAEGPIGFAISGCTDGSGNPQDPLVLTVISAAGAPSTILLDRTPPGVVSATIAGSGPNPAFAREGDTVRVDFATDEALRANPLPDVLIGSRVATVARLTDTSYRATITLGSGDAEGPVGFAISGCADRAGNVAPGIVSHATVGPSDVLFDRIPPAISGVTIASSNNAHALAKPGDTITVAFNVSEPLLGSPAVTIGARTALVESLGGLSFRATITMLGSEAEGPLGFSIYGAVDLAGNAQVSTVTTASAPGDPSIVTYDRTAPSFSPVQVSSSNASPTRAKTGDTVTLSFTASETLLTLPTVNIAGQTAAVVAGAGGAGLAYTATVTLAGAESEGVLAIAIRGAADLAGNVQADVTATSDGSSVTYDRQPPTLTSISVASSGPDPLRARVGDAVLVRLVADEPLVAPPTVTIGGRPAAVVRVSSTEFTATGVMQTTDAEGFVGFGLTGCTDLAGNTQAGLISSATTGPSTIIFDRTAPDFPSISIASSNPTPTLAKTGDTVTVTFTASEALLALPAVTIAGRTAVVTSRGGLLYAATLVLAGTEPEGSIGFVISGATDLAGNPQAAPASVATGGAPSTITYDRTAPAFTEARFASNNDDPTRAKVGDTATLHFLLSEPLSVGPSVTIGARAVPVLNSSATNFTAALTLGPADPEGPLGFVLAGCVDLAGNPQSPAAVVVATDGPSAIIFDRTPPTLERVQFVSTNADPLVAALGDALQLTFTASEPLSAGAPPLVTIAAHNITAVPVVAAAGPLRANAGSVSWSATYIVTDADPMGPLGFLIRSGVDLAGNPLAPRGNATLGPSVIFYGSSCTADPECANGGICVGDLVRSCECAAGYSGPRCETSEGNCTANADCQHGGVCEGSAPERSCNCTLGWGGAQCGAVVEDVFYCRTDPDCREAGDSGAACAAFPQTAQDGGHTVRVWTCVCSPGVSGGGIPPAPCRPTTQYSFWGLYIGGPVGFLLVALCLLMALLLRRRRRKRKEKNFPRVEKLPFAGARTAVQVAAVGVAQAVHDLEKASAAIKRAAGLTPLAIPAGAWEGAQDSPTGGCRPKASFAEPPSPYDSRHPGNRAAAAPPDAAAVTNPLFSGGHRQAEGERSSCPSADEVEYARESRAAGMDTSRSSRSRASNTASGRPGEGEEAGTEGSEEDAATPGDLLASALLVRGRPQSPAARRARPRPSRGRNGDAQEAPACRSEARVAPASRVNTGEDGASGAAVAENEALVLPGAPLVVHPAAGLEDADSLKKDSSTGGPFSARGDDASSSAGRPGGSDATTLGDLLNLLPADPRVPPSAPVAGRPQKPARPSRPRPASSASPEAIPVPISLPPPAPPTRRPIESPVPPPSPAEEATADRFVTTVAAMGRSSRPLFSLVAERVGAAEDARTGAGATPGGDSLASGPSEGALQRGVKPPLPPATPTGGTALPEAGEGRAPPLHPPGRPRPHRGLPAEEPAASPMGPPSSPRPSGGVAEAAADARDEGLLVPTVMSPHLSTTQLEALVRAEQLQAAEAGSRLLSDGAFASPSLATEETLPIPAVGQLRCAAPLTPPHGDPTTSRPSTPPSRVVSVESLVSLVPHSGAATPTAAPATASPAQPEPEPTEELGLGHVSSTGVLPSLLPGLASSPRLCRGNSPGGPEAPDNLGPAPRPQPPVGPQLVSSGPMPESMPPVPMSDPTRGGKVGVPRHSGGPADVDALSTEPPMDLPAMAPQASQSGAPRPTTAWGATPSALDAPAGPPSAAPREPTPAAASPRGGPTARRTRPGQAMEGEEEVASHPFAPLAAVGGSASPGRGSPSAAPHTPSGNAPRPAAAAAAAAAAPPLESGMDASRPVAEALSPAGSLLELAPEAGPSRLVPLIMAICSAPPPPPPAQPPPLHPLTFAPPQLILAPPTVTPPTSPDHPRAEPGAHPLGGAPLASIPLRRGGSPRGTDNPFEFGGERRRVDLHRQGPASTHRRRRRGAAARPSETGDSCGRAGWGPADQSTTSASLVSSFENDASAEGPTLPQEALQHEGGRGEDAQPVSLADLPFNAPHSPPPPSHDTSPPPALLSVPTPPAAPRPPRARPTHAPAPAIPNPLPAPAPPDAAPPASSAPPAPPPAQDDFPEVGELCILAPALVDHAPLIDPFAPRIPAYRRGGLPLPRMRPSFFADQAEGAASQVTEPAFPQQPLESTALLQGFHGHPIPPGAPKHLRPSGVARR